MTEQTTLRMIRRLTDVKRTAIAASVAMAVFLASCGGGGGSGPGKILKKLPVDSATEVIGRKNISTDSGISADGNGSLKIDVSGTQTLPLYKFGDIDLENAMLVYEAALRTENLEGETFLEMICYFQGKGEFFSRNYDTPLSGTNDWKVSSTKFRLKAGENPDMIELNLYVSGKGTVWIDEIRLLQRPLE